MIFSKILHILTVIAAAIFAWKPKAEFGAVFFILLMIEGIRVKITTEIDHKPVKTNIKNYFDVVWNQNFWNRKRTKFQSASIFIPAFIWFIITWIIIPRLIVEQFQPYNTCPNGVIESGNFLIDFMAQLACVAQFMVLPFFITAATAITLFAGGIWILSKIENLYLKNPRKNLTKTK
ncbi:MAG: hypothetical protein ACOYUZ_02000 [Patescibacteria group bacterium]